MVDDHGNRLVPIFKDLASSPWSDNPVLVYSAWQRVKGREWKWALICGEDPVKEDRKRANLPLIKFAKKYSIAKAKWEQEHPRQPRKKRQRAALA